MNILIVVNGNIDCFSVNENINCFFKYMQLEILINSIKIFKLFGHKLDFKTSLRIKIITDADKTYVQCC